MADGEAKKPAALTGEVLPKDERTDDGEVTATDVKELLGMAKEVLSTKSAETIVEAFANVMIARANTDGDASKREHELKMDAQKRRMITSIIGMLLLGVMIATMVVLVQMHMLDETTIQKLAIVVLALLTAGASRSKG